MEKLRKEYETALLCKSVSNLSGLVHSLSQSMKLIQEEGCEQRQGMDYVNNHPIVRVYLEQINSLARRNTPRALNYAGSAPKSNPEREFPFGLHSPILNRRFP